MSSTWPKFIKKFHPEGIPWPATIFYNALSRTDIFHRHYELVAEDAARYCRQGRIADVGAGPGWLLLALHQAMPDAHIIGVDISQGMVSQARQNVERAGCSGAIEVQLGEAAALPFPDGSLDMIVSTGSIHHWKDPAAGLNEVYRVLKPDRCALIYDLVRKTPPEVSKEIKNKYGRFRLTLMWLHSFEEPFYEVEEMEALARESQFKKGLTHFTGALCCLGLHKEPDDKRPKE